MQTVLGNQSLLYWTVEMQLVAFSTVTTTESKLRFTSLTGPIGMVEKFQETEYIPMTSQMKERNSFPRDGGEH